MRLQTPVIAIGSIYLFNIIAWRLYILLPWFDIPMHFAGGLAVGVFGIALYEFLGIRHPQKGWGRYDPILWTVGFVSLVAVLWEYHEYLLDRFYFIPNNLRVSQASISDTMGDLFMGQLGALVAVILWGKKKE